MTTKTASISRTELETKINAKEPIQIINVLDPIDYHMGMIAGSLRIPFETLPRRSTELNKTNEVIVYCANSNCRKSRQAAELLAGLGFQVRAYEGGIQEWTGKMTIKPEPNETTEALREQVLDSSHMFPEP